MSVVEARYAQALLDLVPEKEAALATEKSLSAVVELFSSSTELKEFLCNPLISPSLKHELLAKLFGDEPELVGKFLKLLVDKFRIDLIPGIYKQFEELRLERETVYKMIVVSALPLDADTVEKIRQTFSKKLGKAEVTAETKIDPAIIGGVQVVIGDKVYDGSVKSRFNTLRKAINQSLDAAKID